MLLIYIIMSADSGDKINTPTQIAWVFGSNSSQVNTLTYATAPRNTEFALNSASSDPFQYYNLSFRKAINTSTTVGQNRSDYNKFEINPYEKDSAGIPIRPTANPYFLFFGKFCSQTQQNMDPGKVGHYDISGSTTNQQPSNIYNIPDYPKPYTLIESTTTSYDINSAGSGNYVIYDASSCPVNWRMFGPIQKQVLDWSANGVIGGGGGSLNAGLYDISSNGSFFFVPNPAKRDISGIYFDTNSFDISFNPATNSNMYIGLKGGSGSGTDLSFNEFFFKQPGMPMDCSAVFVNANPKRLELSWDIPFNRLSGTTFTNGKPRFFCKNDESENWLPAFNDFVIDISSNITGAPQTFCKDASGNFVPNNGTTKAYAIISPNNTTVVLNDVLTTALGCQPNQNTSTLKYGTNGSTTTITGGIISGDSARNVDGRGLTINSNTPIFQAGNIYDIAMYYHNNSKINTPPSLAVTDVKYNNHNVCILKNVIFGEPGNAQQPDSLLLWGNPLNNGSRYYFGGIGGNTKDVELNLDWTRTSLVKVGYDCSLNVTPNPSPIQVVGINRQNLSYSNYDVSYNLKTTVPQPYPPLNMNAGVSGSNIPGTKKNWPSGGGIGGSIAVSSSATADSDFDYIKKIDELTGIPAALARDHPEYKYTAENYSVVNDTPDPITNTVTYIHKTPAYTFEGVIPIFPRSACNLTGDTDYNNLMTEYTETPTNNNNANFLTIYKEDNNGNLINAGTGISARTRYLVNGTLTSNPPGTHGTYDDIIAFGDKSNPTYYKLKLKSDTRVFKQLANYGDVLTGIRPSQTVNDLVPPDSMIGKLGLSGATPGLLHEVKLKPEAQISGSSGTFVSIRNGTPNTLDIYGWDTTLQFNVNNVPQTLTVNQTAQDYTFSVSDAFDIAENENTTTVPTNFSNKKGYYLGFDISNVELSASVSDYITQGNTYVDSVFNQDYGQFRISLSSVVKRRIGTDIIKNSSITFRMMDALGIGDITLSPVVTNGHYNSIQFESWFGIVRLPSQANAYPAVFGGPQCELQIDVSLNNISPWWIPTKNQVTNSSVNNPSRDNIFEAEFVLNPNAGVNAIRIKPSILVSGIDGQEYFPWTKPSSPWRKYLPLPTQTPTQTRPNPPPQTPTVYPTTTFRVQAFRELHDGITQITTAPTTSTPTIRFSRTVTDTGNPLFGLKNNRFAYSNNVTRDNIGNHPPNASAMRKYNLSTAETDNFKFGSIKQELFWDYTWPVIVTNLPTGFTNSKLSLMHIENWNINSPAGGYQSASSSSGIWGGNNIELLNLETIISSNTTNPTSSPGIEYRHNEILPDNQSMWCNGFFTGIITNRSQIQNPYINYQAEFFNTSSSSHDYSSKISTGANIHSILINNTVLVSNNNSPGNYFFPQANSNFQPMPPQGTGNIASNATEKKKLILFEVLNTTGNFKVTIKGRTSTGTSDIILTNGVHFFLFYCEKKGSTGTQYTVTKNNGQSTTGDYSGWLNSLSRKQFSGTSGINSIGYANANTNGSNNGCALSTSNFTDDITIVQAQTGVRKFILIALFEDCLIKNVTIT